MPGPGQSGHRRSRPSDDRWLALARVLIYGIIMYYWDMRGRFHRLLFGGRCADYFFFYLGIILEDLIPRG